MNRGIDCVLRTALAVLLLGSPAVTGAGVRIYADEPIQLSRYSGWSWREGTVAANPDVQASIEAAVADELALHGLSRNDESPGLWVVTHAFATNEADVYASRAAVGWVDISSIKRGTLMVDLFDAASDELVWRGTVSDTLKKTPSEQKIRKAVGRLFREFSAEGR